MFDLKKLIVDFPGGPVVKNPPASAGDTGSTLVREDPTCHGTTSPYATTAEPVSHNY